jgi:hypothetical protein
VAIDQFTLGQPTSDEVFSPHREACEPNNQSVNPQGELSGC